MPSNYAKTRKQLNISIEVWRDLDKYARSLGPDTSLNTAIKFLLEKKKRSEPV